MFVSCTSKLLAQTCDFQICTNICRFWGFKKPNKIKVLKQSQSAFLCSVSHMTNLFKFTREVYKKSNERSVCHKLWSNLVTARARLFCWPENVWSNNACQIKAPKDNLRTNFWQISNRSQFFFFELMVVRAWTCDFVQLLGCLVRQFATSRTHTQLFRRPSRSKDHEEIFESNLSFWEGNFSVAPAEILISNMSLSFSTKSLLVSHSRWIQPKWTWSKNDVGSPKSTSFTSSFHIGSTFCSCQPILYRPHTQTRIVLFSWITKKHSQFGTFPNRVPIELSQIAFPITVLPEKGRSDSRCPDAPSCATSRNRPDTLGRLLPSSTTIKIHCTWRTQRALRYSDAETIPKIPTVWTCTSAHPEPLDILELPILIMDWHLRWASLASAASTKKICPTGDFVPIRAFHVTIRDRVGSGVRHLSGMPCVCYRRKTCASTTTRPDWEKRFFATKSDICMTMFVHPDTNVAWNATHVLLPTEAKTHRHSRWSAGTALRAEVVVWSQTDRTSVRSHRCTLVENGSLFPLGCASPTHHHQPTPTNEEEAAMLAALPEPPIETLRRLKTVTAIASSCSTLRSPTFCVSSQFNIHLVFQLDRGNVAVNAHHIEAPPCHLCTSPDCFNRQAFHGCHPLSNVNCLPMHHFKQRHGLGDHFFISIIIDEFASLGINLTSAIHHSYAAFCKPPGKQKSVARKSPNLAKNSTVMVL